MGGSSETTTTPSIFDTQKGVTAQMMSKYLMPMITAGLKGQATPLQAGATQNVLNQSKHSLMRMGVDVGTPQFKDYERMMSESLTKPNMDMLKLAMSMYGASNVTAPGSSSTTTNPGALQVGSELGSLAMLASMLCWVAREVYGEKNPKWIKFRTWMLTKSPRWFCRLYIKHGQSFALFIRNKPRIKKYIRMWMDTRIAEG